MVSVNFFVLALLLGIKHSYDTDHILAVSNLLTRAKSLSHATKMSISWAMGHMITATAITAFLYVFRDSVLSFVLGKFELLVGIMLVFLGVVSLAQVSLVHFGRHRHGAKKHEHEHAHVAGPDHSHRHMFGIGIVHGLASNDELLVLLTSALGQTALAGMLAGLVVFTLGVVIGMVGFSILLTYPIIKIRKEALSNAVNLVAGVLSIAYGLALLLGVA